VMLHVQFVELIGFRSSDPAICFAVALRPWRTRTLRIDPPGEYHKQQSKRLKWWVIHDGTSSESLTLSDRADNNSRRSFMDTWRGRSYRRGDRTVHYNIEETQMTYKMGC
jgi:hypothetical protein